MNGQELPYSLRDVSLSNCIGSTERRRVSLSSNVKNTRSGVPPPRVSLNYSDIASLMYDGESSRISRKCPDDSLHDIIKTADIRR